jgi:glycine oxidase
MSTRQARAHPDVLVVGGGAIGLLSALELAGEGLSVTVLERGQTGQESSWAGGGILSPVDPWRAADPIGTLCRWSRSRYPDLAKRLLAETGIDPEWVRSGLLIACGGEFPEASDWCQREHLDWLPVTPDQLAGMEPHIRVSNHALLIPEIAQIRNPRFLRALRRAAELHGVEILEERQMDAFELSGERVKCVHASGERYCAERFLLAAGAWSRLLTPNLIPPVQIEPVKGQMLAYQGRPGWLSHILISDGRYLIPRRDGVILAGSTVEYADFDKAPTEAARAQLEAYAGSVLPELRGAPILRHWAGLRPGSPNGIPYICRHAQLENFYLNCGHFRNGLVSAPASARLITDIILNRQPSIPPEPYAMEAVH